MSWLVTNLISALLLPPLNLLLLFALAILSLKRRPKMSCFLLVFVFVVFWLFSTPYFSDSVLHILESKTEVVTHPVQAQAIVILGGGSYFRAPEYSSQETVNDITLVRLRYGAKLYRQTHLPVLVFHKATGFRRLCK